MIWPWFALLSFFTKKQQIVKYNLSQPCTQGKTNTTIPELQTLCILQLFKAPNLLQLTLNCFCLTNASPENTDITENSDLKKLFLKKEQWSSKINVVFWLLVKTLIHNLKLCYFKITSQFRVLTLGQLSTLNFLSFNPGKVLKKSISTS